MYQNIIRLEVENDYSSKVFRTIDNCSGDERWSICKINILIFKSIIERCEMLQVWLSEYLSMPQELCLYIREVNSWFSVEHKWPLEVYQQLRWWIKSCSFIMLHSGDSCRSYWTFDQLETPNFFLFGNYFCHAKCCSLTLMKNPKYPSNTNIHFWTHQNIRKI